MSNAQLVIEVTGILKGWPRDVLAPARRTVAHLAGLRQIDRFYIGRGVDPEKRRSAHRAHAVVPIYETDSVENAMQVEEFLNARFFNHAKNDNASWDARGGTSQDYVNYVYVALWVRP